jgi:hypothetical protein
MVETMEALCEAFTEWDDDNMSSDGSNSVIAVTVIGQKLQSPMIDTIL